MKEISPKQREGEIGGTKREMIDHTKEVDGNRMFFGNTAAQTPF